MLLADGYYWYRVRGRDGWSICQVSSGYVHFFGQVSQEIGNEYLTQCVEFGERIEHGDAARTT